MQDRFSDEDRHARHLLCLVTSIIVEKTLQLDDEAEGHAVLEKRHSISQTLGNEVRRWKTLWQSTDRKIPNNLLLALGVCNEDAFPNICHLLVIACTQPITSAEAKRSFSLMK